MSFSTVLAIAVALAVSLALAALQVWSEPAPAATPAADAQLPPGMSEWAHVPHACPAPCDWMSLMSSAHRR